jgi:hypothetical protein
MLMQRPLPSGAPAPARARPHPADRTHRSLRVVFAVLVCLGVTLALGGTALAAPSSPHISISSTQYGVNQWYTSGGSSGIATRLDPRGSMSCSGCAGFIANTTWFGDASSSACTSDAYAACWVEVSVRTYPAIAGSCHPSAPSICLMWADMRPYGGGYHEHQLYYVGADGLDLTPYYFDMSTYNHYVHSNAGATWDVHTHVIKNGVTLASPTGLSTSNNMAVDHQTIGCERSASGGSAAVFGFIDNRWQGSDGVWNYNASEGTVRSDNPPYASWTIAPHGANNLGGRFETHT